MKNSLWKLVSIIPVILLFWSCDKVEPPYQTAQNASGSNEGGTINLNNIPGTISNLRFKNFIADSAELKANWVVSGNAQGTAATITFTWHAGNAQLSGTGPVGGPATISGRVTIDGGGIFGRIIFDYSADVIVSGFGTGTVICHAQPQKVLVEDYTGHTCGNCPRASRAAYALKPLYGSKLIIIAVHAGFFAWVQNPNYTYNFQTAAGTAWDNFFGISNAGNPNGMVNRRKVNGNFVIPYTAWGSNAQNIFDAKGNSPDAVIQIINEFDNASRMLNTEVWCALLKDFTGSYKMQLCLIEDSIIKWQKDYDFTPEDIPDYVHRDALRGDINGIWGEEIISGFGASQTIIRKTYSTSVNSEFNEAHCKVLAFLYRDSDKEIVQANEEHVLE